jgi:small subunit ribosomal protein S13
MLSLKETLLKTKKKSFLQSFQSTFGIGKKRVCQLRLKCGINPSFFNSKSKMIVNKKIKRFFTKSIFSTELRAQNKKYFNFFWTIRIYKGFRHKFKLPGRGQRTKTNAKTKKKIKMY